MKLEKLTREQELLMTVVREEWIAFALGKDASKDEINKESFTEGVQWIYSLSQLKSPFVLIVDSPLAAQYAITYYKAIQKKYGELPSPKKEVGAQVRDQVWAQVRDQVGDQVGAQVRDQVRAQVGDQVWAQVRDQVRAQVWDQVGAQVRDQVRAQVWDQVWAQVGAQVRDQVRAQVGDQVGAQVRAQVGDQDNYYFSYENNAFYSDWGAWADFFNRINIISGEEKKKLEKYLEYLHSGVFLTVFLDGLAVACRRPSEVHKNDTGRLHNESGPALLWRDSYSLYALNGVRFPKDLFEKVTSGKMPFAEIMAIEDIDQRTQAMKYGDLGEFLRYSKAKILDERVKHTPDNSLVFYKLYQIPKGDIFTKEAFYMVYTDPSTGKEYMSGVKPAKTVAEAMAWKISTDTHIVTPKQWENLVPLVTES